MKHTNPKVSFSTITVLCIYASHMEITAQNKYGRECFSSRLTKYITAVCSFQRLGEIDAIRQMYVQRVADAL